jgi:hypothetical protein
MCFVEKHRRGLCAFLGILAKVQKKYILSTKAQEGVCAFLEFLQRYRKSIQKHRRGVCAFLGILSINQFAK